MDDIIMANKMCVCGGGGTLLRMLLEKIFLALKKRIGLPWWRSG